MVIIILNHKLWLNLEPQLVLGVRLVYDCASPSLINIWIGRRAKLLRVVIRVAKHVASTILFLPTCLLAQHLCIQLHEVLGWPFLLKCCLLLETLHVLAPVVHD